MVNFLFNLDVGVYVYAGLFLFLIVGIMIKDRPKTIREYALGSKPFTTPVLVATMAATVIGGGSTIGRIRYYYEEGLFLVLPGLLSYFGVIIFVHYVLPRFDAYYKEFSIVSVLSRIYGDSVEKISGIIAYLYCFGALAMQVKAIGLVIEYALNYNSTFATILSFLVITIYSAFGGVQSVIRTDVVQFIIFIIVLPIFAIFLLKESGGIHHVFQKKVWEVKNYIVPIEYIALFIFNFLPNVSPIMTHRILVGGNEGSNRRTIYFSSLIQIICIFFVIIVSAVAMNKYQGMDSNLVFFQTVESVIQNNLLHALFAIALLAVILSSADSLVNTGAVIFVVNIIKNRIKDEKDKLVVLRIVTILSGLLGLFIALKIKSLLGVIWFVAQYYSVIMLIPFIGGLFIKEGKPVIFWASSITGFLSHTLLKILAPEIEHTAYIISLFMSFIAFIVTKYLVEESIDYNGKSISNMENLTANIIKQMNIPVSKLSYAILPISIFTLFMEAISNEMTTNTMVLKVIMGAIGLSFVFVDEIFKHRKSIVCNCYVLLAIWYCFPFLSSYLYYTLPNSNAALANMVISCTLLTAILSSKLLFIYTITGAIFGSIAFVILKPIVLGEFILHAIVIAAVALYVSIISLFILKTKEGGIRKFISDLKENTKDTNKKTSDILKEYANVIDIVKRHEKAKEVFLEQREKFKGYVEFNDIVTLNIEELVETLKDYLSLVELEKVIKFNIENKTKHITITKPESMIYTVIFSIAHYMVGFDKDLIKINISCKNKQLCVRYSLENLKLNIVEIKKYVKDLNRPDGVMSFELIEKIINKQDDMELKMSQNSIILSMRTLTGEIKEENTKFISLSSQENEKPKVLN